MSAPNCALSASCGLVHAHKTRTVDPLHPGAPPSSWPTRHGLAVKPNRWGNEGGQSDPVRAQNGHNQGDEDGG